MSAETHQPKHFVLDTNVLRHNPAALFMFTDNVVVIPFTVLEELDKFKKEQRGRAQCPPAHSPP